MKKAPRKIKSRSHFLWLGIFSSVSLLAFLAALPARGQVGLRYDMANQITLQPQNTLKPQEPVYSFKSGDFRMLLQPQLSLQWNDNINCAETGKEDDFIVLPSLMIVATYPITKENTLTFNVTIGYSRYLLHPSLSSIYLQSQTGSGLSFNIVHKNFLANVHDEFSYVQDTAQNPAIAGTATSGSFQNDAGISGTWKLKYEDFTAGFDHQNTIATSAEFSDTDASIESGYTRLGYKWNPAVTTGVEGTVAYTAYDQGVLNNNTSYSLGVYADVHPDAYLEIRPRLGYTWDVFDQTSQSLQTSDLSSWYADLSINHQLTKRFSYTIDGGRNAGLGEQSDANEYWYANASITWNFLKGFSLQPQFSYQHGNQGTGSSPLNGVNLASIGLVSETYDWYNAGISFGYDLTKRFTLSWNYQFTDRTSTESGRGYVQNVIGLLLTYHPI